MFDGLGGNIDAEICAVTVICDLDVDGETFRVLKLKKQRKNKTSALHLHLKYNTISGTSETKTKEYIPVHKSVYDLYRLLGHRL